MMGQFVEGFIIDSMPIIMGACVLVRSITFFKKTSQYSSQLCTEVALRHRASHVALASITMIAVSFYIAEKLIHLSQDAANGFNLSYAHFTDSIFSTFLLALGVLWANHLIEEEGGELSYFDTNIKHCRHRRESDIDG